ncbi:MAG TPA: dUTP diphosphatase [Herbaspirillum sp.]|uniref:dUTP diphosphatase n=1 Tax=Herbaspirillum sp. TaxID=1890675 RepID=UPI002D4C5721|nr:dUTP diphosphatase [Herbaspirillum sp.]HZG18629.1 dUTP diphosphatase [Herbaspirillum sp.]
MEPLRMAQAAQMLTLQGEMNSTVNPEWISAKYPFLRAVVVEVAEALDHYGWKWWKKEQPDLAQVQIELIDILHFILSHELLQAEGDVRKAAESVVEKSNPTQYTIEFDGSAHLLDRNDPRTLLELLGGLASVRRCEIGVLEACFDSLDMSWDDVTRQYISKNVLNIFRQHNGYKSGTYIKTWMGKEDNVHLVELTSTLDPKQDSFAKDLYHALVKRYSEVNAEASS